MTAGALYPLKHRNGTFIDLRYGTWLQFVHQPEKGVETLRTHLHRTFPVLRAKQIPSSFLSIGSPSTASNQRMASPSSFSSYFALALKTINQASLSNLEFQFRIESKEFITFSISNDGHVI